MFEPWRLVNVTSISVGVKRIGYLPNNTNKKEKLKIQALRNLETFHAPNDNSHHLNVQDMSVPGYPPNPSEAIEVDYCEEPLQENNEAGVAHEYNPIRCEDDVADMSDTHDLPSALSAWALDCDIKHQHLSGLLKILKKTWT